MSGEGVLGEVEIPAETDGYKALRTEVASGSIEGVEYTITQGGELRVEFGEYDDPDVVFSLQDIVKQAYQQAYERVGDVNTSGGES